MNARLNKRLSRLKKLFAFDQTLLDSFNRTQKVSLKGVVGVDEVGRGSLIGPVVAAAVIFNDISCKEFFNELLDLDDSKSSHLNHQKRVYLAAQLKKICKWSIGESSKLEVETLNVYQASLLASYRAINNLKNQFPECRLEEYLIIVDGKSTIPYISSSQTCEVKADSKSASVASASIMAKSYRDELVINLSRAYPGYEWDKNAGYPTPSHKKAIEVLGFTPLHRTTYKIRKTVV